MFSGSLAKLALGGIMLGALAAGDCAVKSGAYAGVGLGVSHLGGTTKYNVTNTGARNAFPGQFGLPTNSFLAGVFAGYGHKISNMWLAAELFYNFDNLKGNAKVKFGDLLINERKEFKLNSNGAWGGALHLGAFTTPGTVVYAIIGLETRRFKARFIDPAAELPLLQYGKGYTGLAFAPGVGARMNVTRNMFMRLEYKCALYGNKKTGKSASGVADLFANAGSTSSLAVKNKPTIHSFSVGFAYAF